MSMGAVEALKDLGFTRWNHTIKSINQKLRSNIRFYSQGGGGGAKTASSSSASEAMRSRHPYISFFGEWRSSVSIPVSEVQKVYFEGSKEEDDGSEESSAISSEKLLYSLEFAGKDLKVKRMAVPIRDMETENLLD